MGVITKIKNKVKRLLGVGKRPEGQQQTVVKQPSIADMTDEDKISRDIANSAYDKHGERGNIGDYQVDKDLSDKNTVVYYNKKKGKARIGYRGTADLKDLYTDVADPRGNIVHGTQHTNPHFQNALTKYDAVKNKYGNVGGVSGHSLGGAVSKYVSKKKNVSGQGFNVGTGFDKGGVVDKLKCSNPIKKMRPTWCNLFTSHHIKGDALSVMDRFGYGKHKNYKGKMPWKAHSLKNFYDQKG